MQIRFCIVDHALAFESSSWTHATEYGDWASERAERFERFNASQRGHGASAAELIHGIVLSDRKTEYEEPTAVFLSNKNNMITDFAIMNLKIYTEWMSKSAR